MQDTHYNMFIFVSIPVNKQWARLTKANSYELADIWFFFGSVSVADMCSRAAKKDLARTCGPKTFQRKIQIEKNLQSKQIMR